MMYYLQHAPLGTEEPKKGWRILYADEYLGEFVLSQSNVSLRLEYLEGQDTLKATAERQKAGTQKQFTRCS
jgi:hypothetical protein